MSNIILLDKLIYKNYANFRKIINEYLINNIKYFEGKLKLMNIFLKASQNKQRKKKKNTEAV